MLSIKVIHLVHYLTIILLLNQCNVNQCVQLFISRCKEPLNIYESLGCNAVYSKNKHGDENLCPDCFDCSQINPVVKKCYYQGKYYAFGEEINGCANLPNCYMGCTCTEDLSFVCAVADCAFKNIPENCYHTPGLSGCCPTTYNCINNNTFHCDVNEQNYYLDQVFPNPRDPCSRCECVPGVTGKPGDPHCAKNACDIELFQSNNILAYCAPVYNKRTDCCPMTYICPREDDVFIASCSYDLGLDSDLFCPVSNDICSPGNCKQCRFGNKLYEIGVRFKRIEKYEYSEEELYVTTKCECKIPPYFTCIQGLPKPKS